MCTFRHLTLKWRWRDDEDEEDDDDDNNHKEEDDDNDDDEEDDDDLKPSLHQGVMPVQLPKKHWVVLFPFSM